MRRDIHIHCRDMGAKYTARPWSCKDYDEEDCRQQVLCCLKEHYNTAYDCVFVSAAASGFKEGLIITGYHSGDIRLFNWQHVCSTWLGSRAQQPPALSWQGHSGPVYAVALLHMADHGLLLATGGDDGCVKIWKMADILEAAAAAAAAAPPAAAAAVNGSDSQSSAARMQPAAAVQLPHVQNLLGVSEGSQPAAQALAADHQRQRLYIGASDGGVHALDVASLLAAAAHGQGLAAAAAGCLRSLPGHAAAVLGMDYCAATQQLASGSEDGTVRIWDCQALRCVNIFNPHEEVVVPADSQVELLRCVRSPPVMCVKFDAGGQWLVAGTGQSSLSSNQGGTLTLWNCSLNAVAKHKSTGKCIPQVLAVAPSIVYMAGTGKQLRQYSFQLEELRALDVGSESAFGLDIDAGSGMVAVCGSKACIDLLSAQGASLGVVRPAPSVLTG